MTRALVLALLALAACDQASGAGGILRDGAEEIGAAHGEILCALHPDVCGDVFMCEAEADNALGHVEICVQRDADFAAVESQFGECVPTPRHVGLCYWHCDEGKGCNAFNSCWCEGA